MSRIIITLFFSAAILVSVATSAPVLEEVVVTAQKRAESLQDTPIAIDAFGAVRLEQEGISNVADLANNVPALTIEPFPTSAATLRIYIRGIGQIDAQVTQDPPIAVYVDGAYIARSSGLASDIADLERVEVLRGPQGTLYGRNSTGGAINMITKRPNVDELEVLQTLTRGNRSLFSSRTSLNVPLWSGAAAKVAYFNSEVEGFIERTGPGGGRDFGDKYAEGYRFDFGWDINHSLRMDYSYDSSNQVSYTQSYSPVFPGVPIDTGDPAADALMAQIHEGARSFFTHLGPNRPRSLPTVKPLLPSESDISGHRLSFDYSLNDALNIKYIYAKRSLFDPAYVDLAGGSEAEGFRIDTNEAVSFDPDGAGILRRSVYFPREHITLSQKQFSHELQFSGALFSGRLSHISGVYYFQETGGEIHELGFQARLPVGNTGLVLEQLSQDFSKIENRAAAVFSQLTWRPPILNDRLAITIGGRYSEDTRRAQIHDRVINFLVTPVMGNRDVSQLDTATEISDDSLQETAEKKFTDDSFALILEYAMTADINLYAKAVEAYKSGGFTIREPVGGTFGGESAAERFRNGFEPEQALSYEVGTKIQVFNNRLRINANVFQTSIKDQQLAFSVPGSLTDSTVANLGKTDLLGLELDLNYAALERLILTVNYAYLDSEVADTVDPLTGRPTSSFVLNSAPRNAYTVAADWTVMENEFGRLALNATYSFTDERNGGALEQFSTFQFDRADDFSVLNARLGLYDIPAFGGELNMAVWVKNLLDEEYTVSNVHALPQSSRSSLWGDARSYGLDLIYRFSQ